ncbi:MAG: hypothetical protein DMG07_16645, partial [Acidobacteria bacterium]
MSPRSVLIVAMYFFRESIFISGSRFHCFDIHTLPSWSSGPKRKRRRFVPRMQWRRAPGEFCYDGPPGRAMTETREVYRKLGSTGLRCHMLGFGCYRIAAGDEVHEAALVSYLERGGNLIDTSANYGDGLSETLVGQVLAGRERGKVLVVTKGGYIQGQNMELARRRNFPETVYYGEGIWHSIHPDFLETQVERSLERMRLGKIDVYLLHNPEYFLTEK